jgi:hypothetical protein
VASDWIATSEQQPQITTTNESKRGSSIQLKGEIKMVGVKRDSRVHIVNHVAHADDVRICLAHMQCITSTQGATIGSAGAARAGQSQPTEGHGDQPQHEGRGATDYSVASAGTTFGNGQI